MGASQRRKGHDFERECARALTAATGLVHARVLVECRDGNCGDIASPLPLALQCKVGARPLPFDALEEAIAVAQSGDVPVALIRRNATPGRAMADLAVMRLDDWLTWLERLTPQLYAAANRQAGAREQRLTASAFPSRG